MLSVFVSYWQFSFLLQYPSVDVAVDSPSLVHHSVILDLYVFCDFSLMSWNAFIQTEQLNESQHDKTSKITCALRERLIV